MTIVEGGVDIVPQTQLATGAVDFAIAWVPKALASREQGAKITDIGQIYQRSGTLQVSWKDSGRPRPRAWPARRSATGASATSSSCSPACQKAGVDPKSGVTLVQQQFDMAALLEQQIDAAQAMIYNEYAQVLEAEEPGDRRALPADRPQRHRLEQGRRRHAPGRHLGQHRQARRTTRPTRTPR